MYALWKCQDCQYLFLKQSTGLYSCKKKIFTDCKRSVAALMAECFKYKEVKQKG